jgi:putative ABC transport system permease protein
VAVALLEAGLGAEVDHQRKPDAPSFFFVDVQDDQRDAFARVVREAGGVEPALTAIVRARLAAVDGRAVDRAMYARQRAASGEEPWWLTRDYALTTMAEPPAHNRITRGRWWTPGGPPARPLISVEEVAAAKMGVDVGGTLTFDVQGVPVEATVASLRRVDWSSLAQNFFVIFSPGALDGAPTTWIATARVPPAVEGRVQDAVAAAFPNVTALPVRDILARVAGVLDRLAFVVRAVALFCIGAGLVVTAGSLAASRYQRLAESVILRTLGATRSTVARIFAVEYACLGAVAGLGGTALAAALAWIVLRFFLDVPWPAAPGVLALGLLLATALAVAVGVLATFRLLGEKPLPVLRRE